MTTHILQVIPTPPNMSDGIGDYSLLLAEQLLKDFKVMTHFLVFRLDVNVDPIVNGFPMIGLSAHNIEAFASALPKNIDAIILHFSHYPYFNTSLRGVFGFETPFWFTQALEKSINLNQFKLIVMFDELPKLSWKELHFFNTLNPIHCRVSHRIAEIASSVVTDNSRNQAILSNWIKKAVPQIPIFSTIGEPEHVPILTERKARMIVFGGSARSRIYNSQSSVNVLIEACYALGIKEIYDVGPLLDLKNKYDFQDVSFIEMGYLSPQDIQLLMLTSVAGCLDYTPFPGELAKSSVFAAYCAHGVIPISTQYNPSEVDGIFVNQHYLNLNNLQSMSLDKLQVISDNVQDWYQPRSLKAVAQMFASRIFDRV